MENYRHITWRRVGLVRPWPRPIQNDSDLSQGPAVCSAAQSGDGQLAALLFATLWRTSRRDRGARSLRGIDVRRRGSLPPGGDRMRRKRSLAPDTTYTGSGTVVWMRIRDFFKRFSASGAAPG